MNHHCIPCNLPFKSNKCLQQHFKCNRHIERINNQSEIPKYECSVCGKKYSIRQSLHAHTKLKSCVVVTAAPIVPTVESPIEAMQKKLVIYEKDCIDQKKIVQSMQQKINVQQKSIESMQQKIDLIAILLKNGAGHESTSNQCLITQQAQYQKSRDKRKKISKDMRQHVVNKQENACGMCKLVLTPYFEIDHIIGLQFGGTDDEANLMALCRDCHAKKSIKENQCREQIKEAIQSIVSENQGDLSPLPPCSVDIKS